MSGVLHGVLSAIAAAARDAFFKYVTLLLHGDGTNGAQNNTFLDGSTNNFTITRNGNTTQGSFSPFSQTGWSNYFDGTGDSLSISTSTALQFGTGAFTIEFWFNTTATTQYASFVSNEVASPASGFTVLINSVASNGFIQIYNGSSGLILSSNASWRDNSWHHLAWVRDGTSARLYIDGVLIDTNVGQATFSMDVGTTWYIGNNNAFAGRGYTGYLSNFRVLKGTAQYTANFTPPTAPLTAITNTSLLTCQSNRFIDNSSNAFAITRNGDVRVEAFSPFNPSTTYSTSVVGGSGYFDGTGDYLTAPDNAAFDFGSGNWTVETWVYPLVFSFGITAKRTNANTDFRWIVGSVNADGTINTLIATSAGAWAVSANSASAISLGQWSHVAWVRNGSDVSVYVNGVKNTLSAAFSGSVYVSTEPVVIGATGTSGQVAQINANGYISNLRIVKGTAVYTAAFTPPTSPLTAITNTSLLCNFTNGGVFDNASQTVLETVGNAQVSTTQKKYGTGSMYFDGTGDWLTAPDRPAQRFGTADFTVEGWLYLGATGAARGIISKGTASTGWSVNVTSGNKLQFSYTASNLTGVTSLAGSTWYHFTAMRTGGSIRVYLNGTQEVTNSTAITDNFNQTNILYVGADRVGGSALNGYIDDLRVTNGYARYNNFTPSVTALTPTAYTAALPNTSTTNGAQNNTFLDGSTNNFTITRNGNTTQGTFSPFSNSGWSNYFDGTGDYLSAAANTAFDFGSGDFTVELWINPSSRTNTDGVISKGNTSSTGNEVWSLEWNSTNNLNFYSGGGLVSPVVVSTTQFAIGVWYHVAVARSGATTKIFVNGTEEASSTTSYTVTAGGTLYIGTGWFAPATRDTSGYISNARIVKGTAVYTSNFTPPTSPLTNITNTSLLTCQSNRFIDNSTNAFAITRNGDVSAQAFSPFTPAAYSSSTNGGSGYFDGTGDYLSLADNAALNMGSSDFTIESWVYTNSGTTGAIVDKDGTSAVSWAQYLLYITAGGKFEAIISTTTTFAPPGIPSARLTGTTTVQVGTWYHVAVTRVGTNATLWVNGVSEATSSTVPATLNTRNQPATIGTSNNAGTGASFLNGYLSNTRIVKGTAVYTSAFTPPTAPLTAITNTSLLLNFTNAGIFDAVGINNYETVGNAQASTTQAKFGTTSMYFDGTGDWLTAPDRPVNQLRAGNFTIEGWFYLSATGAARGLVSKGTSTTGWSVNITSGNKLQFSYTSSNLTGATTLAASTWYHFAVVRSGGTVQIYLNGVQDAISSSAITTDFNQTNILYIGADRVGGSAMNGYLDDIRITPGQALYPGNFTPPTAPFPNN